MFLFSKSDILSLKILRILLAACLAIPLLASSAVIFPYTAPKAFAFRALVEIAAVFYLYLALKDPAHFFPTFKKSGWGGFLILSVLTFLVINLLSALFSLDFYNSFWGNLERGIGVWGLLHFIGWFFMLVGVFQSQKDWKNLMQISVCVSFLVAVMAIAQKFFSLGDLLPRVDRVFSLIGNPAFLGTYLIFNIFLAGYLFFESAGNKKWFFAISSWLLAISLLFSGTRGAILGLAAGMIVFLGFLFFNPLFKGGLGGVKKWSLFFLVAVAILIGSLFLFRDSSFVKNSHILSRFTRISLSDPTIQSRLILWQDAWRAWQARPTLGAGPENFEAAMGPYLSSRLAAFEAYGFDRAHNLIFDYGATLGWLGLVSYLLMIGAAGWALVLFVIPAKAGIRVESIPESRLPRLARRVGEARREAGMTENKKDGFLFSVIFLSLLAAYFVQNLLIFDSFVSYLMLFFTLAIIANFTQSDCVKSGADNSGDTSAFYQRGVSRNDEFSIFKKLILLFAIGCSLLVMYFFNLKPFYAGYLANQILSLPPSDAAQGTPLFKDALNLNTFASPEIAYQVAIDYIDKIAQEPALAQNEEFYTIVSTQLLGTIERSPEQSRNYIALAWLNLYFSGKDRQRINKALDLGDKILTLSPIKKDGYLILAAGYALSNQPAKAREVISQVGKIDVKMGEEIKNYYEKLK